MSEASKWIEKARETYKFHKTKLLSNSDWTVAKTAHALRRSIGSICEDLLIARWLKTHEPQLTKFSHAYEALEFIREEKRKLELE